MCLPEGWTAQDTGYALGHAADVLLLVRNCAAQRIEPYGSGIVQQGEKLTFPELIRDRLPVGALVIVFAHTDVLPGAWDGYRADTVGDSLAELLDTMHPAWQSTSGLSTYSVGFAKWGRVWQVWSHSRGKPSSRDRRTVEQILRSVSFPARPILIPEQALRVAYSLLPSSAHDRACPECPTEVLMLRAESVEILPLGEDLSR